MSSFRNKKIFLVGLGKFKKGSGVSAVTFLASQGADLTVTDLKTKKELAKNLQALKKFKNIKYVLGRHRQEDFQAADWVVRNPDVPPSSPYLAIARQRGVLIDNDITLFFRAHGISDVIGVTGTRGKSTTASLIYEMARRQFPEARLGGNIGESPLRFLGKIKKGAPVVLELSNFQLSDLGAVKMSPLVAVWTNFYPDHLNKYAALAEYEAVKMKIFQFQKAGDKAVLNWDNLATRKNGQKLKKSGPAGRKVWFFSLKQKISPGAYVKNGFFVFNNGEKETQVARISDTPLLGEHNRANILAAICAGRAFGIGWTSIRSAIKEFKGVPNRLELARKIDNVSFYNDCTATSPEATIAALKSFPAGKIILITGGNSKDSPLKNMAQEIGQRARAAILVSGQVNEELKKLIREVRGDIIIRQAKNLKDAIEQARELAKPGDAVLFSPGLTWLPGQNEFARGKEFKKIIKKLKKN
ncbi:MAG: UDP-N-acetylmuramoyl-L-alanine--D-glutamate ligase [Candidatus Magasanikbacteria bacterium]|nr:UDP-N-acetylmuramoyl-L-alanine--D-glutamate ligase [Candidatus Magasanikbacteria bacterium]